MNHFTGSKQMPNQTLEELKLSKVKLISQKNACKLIDRAYALNRAHPQLRVGQNLWNYMNEDFPEVANMFHGTPNDFFYQTIPAKAVETFLTHCVEK